MKTVIYKGIADCHGIESFVPRDDKKVSEGILSLRAESNRQRHAILYFAELTEATAKTVNREIDKGNYEMALMTLKAVAKKWWFPKGKEKQYLNSLELIPNSKLDPWR